MARWVALVLVLSSSVVTAQEAPAGQDWSVVGPKTVAENRNALEGSLGWPGLSAGYLRGIAPRINLGVRAGFVYGVEGVVSAVAPGLKLQLLGKLLLLDQGRISLGVTFEPGPVFYGGVGGFAGFTLPVGLRLGIAASSALQLAVLLEVPLWISFGLASSFNLPVLTGIGVEYFIQSDLLVFVRVRMGPTLILRTSFAEFSLDTAVGVGWRF